jgi:non-ribosomal peptide synthetase component E (peptide arylation enzyme)
VPKAVLFVDTMPRTPVGKVDYKGATDLAISLLAG